MALTHFPSNIDDLLKEPPLSVKTRNVDTEGSNQTSYNWSAHLISIYFCPLFHYEQAPGQLLLFTFSLRLYKQLLLFTLPLRVYEQLLLFTFPLRFYEQLLLFTFPLRVYEQLYFCSQSHYGRLSSCFCPSFRYGR